MLGHNLKIYRTKNNYSQVDIANILNVTKQTVSNWEKGKRLPDINILIKLANLYNVTLDTLTGSDKRNSSIEMLNVVSNLPNDKKDKLLDFLKVIAE